MKIVFLTGNHLRHSYMAHCLHQTGWLSGIVVEQREAFLPKPSQDLRPQTACLFEKHFRERNYSEEHFFGSYKALPAVDVLKVSREDLNSTRVQAFIKDRIPDLILSYGVHKLSNEVIVLADEAWNIHGGLSPWYRGCITHFWPSYMLEPQMTGMTVHTLTQSLDAGDIIHQVTASLASGDGIHDLACKAVQLLGLQMPLLLCLYAQRSLKSYRAQTTTGRIWRSADWMPEHLHLIYDLYDNKIVDYVLGHKRPIKMPVLMRQF